MDRKKIPYTTSTWTLAIQERTERLKSIFCSFSPSCFCLRKKTFCWHRIYIEIEASEHYRKKKQFFLSIAHHCKNEMLMILRVGRHEGSAKKLIHFFRPFHDTALDEIFINEMLLSQRTSRLIPHLYVLPFTCMYDISIERPPKALWKNKIESFHSQMPASHASK